MSKQTGLPPLNPLHVFEVASRLLSFTKAADELSVTQSAVSRQIAALEAAINVKLFNRERDGLVLTTAGEAYRKEIGPAFARILWATNEIRAHRLSIPLQLRVYSSFASRWLIPRLPSFRARHPGIELRMNTAAQPVDFSRDTVDLAIQFGDGNWPNISSKKIMDDAIQPVCSRGLLDKVGGIRTVDDLAKVQLISARLRALDWKDWLKAQNANISLRNCMEFPSSQLAYEAAATGLGVAMGQLALVQGDVADGRLVYLFDKPLKRRLGYYAMWPKDLSLSPNMRKFLDWLSSEASAQTAV
jgi:LysR family glycine cleavage system transcriptional activator